MSATAAALERSIEACDFGDAILFSHENVAGTFRSVEIDRIGSTAAYSEFLYKQFPRMIQTPFVLVVQWDGYVVDPSAWSEDFRQYDYVGAPWPFENDDMAVGNGGFSLQSRAFMQAMLDDRFPLRDDVNSDWLICRTYRARLEREFGLRFAPPAVARKFSYETIALREFTAERAPTFGFHGMGNMWRHVDEADMIALLDRLSPYVFGTLHFANLLVTYFLLGRYKAFGALYAKLREHLPDDTVRMIGQVFGDNNRDIAELCAELGDRLVRRKGRVWMLGGALARAQRRALLRLA